MRLTELLADSDGENTFVSLAARPGRFGETVHNAAFRHCGLPYRYVPLLCEDIVHDMALLRASRIRGAGITMPHKVAVMALLDEISPSARDIGSVNTVVRQDGKLVGHNTDLRGARASLVGTHSRDHFVILGRGGMARTFLYSLHGNRVTTLSRENWDTVVEDATVLINATPMGMSGSDFTISLDQFPKLRRYIDSVVGETPVLLEAKRRGLEIVPGLDITFNQAFEQFEHYTDLPAPEHEMKIAFTGV